MSGLDPIGRKEIRDLILRLKADGKTVFMNTHILPDVEMLCDRVAIIVRGRIQHEGEIERFLEEGERQAEVVLAGLPPEIPSQLEEVFGARLRGLGERIEVRRAREGRAGGAAERSRGGGAGGLGDPPPGLPRVDLPATP